MKNLITFLFCFVSLSAFGQGLKLNFMTTNQTMVTLPSDGYIPIWNDTAKRWSNGPVSATATNLPSYVITNINEGNKLYVRTNGDNTTAVRGRLDKPWAHITNAFASAVAGDWIDVDSGLYYIPTNTTSLARSGVTWNFRDTVVTSGNPADAANDTFLFDDFGGAVTDFVVLGSAKFYMSNVLGRVAYFQDTGSTYTLKGRVARALGQVAALQLNAGTGYIYFDEEIVSDGYDGILNDADPNTSKLYVYCPRILGGDSSIEIGRSFAKYGDGVFEVGYMQGHFNIVDNMLVNGATINLQTNFVIYSSTATMLGNGILQNAIVYGASNRSLSLIQPVADGYRTDGTFRNVSFYGSSNRNAILIDSTSPMTFDNCRIFDGWGSTNSIWATNAQSFKIAGTLMAPKKWNSNVSVIEQTNILSGYLNLGKGTNSGELRVGGQLTAFAGIESRSDINIVNGDFYGIAGIMSNLNLSIGLNLPNSSGPSTAAIGDVAVDDNAWAAGRGALQLFDGTANTYLVGALAADTPSNGQVPKWNTGGTITWEDDSGGSASAAGDSGRVQFAEGTSFAGTNDLVFNRTNRLLTIGTGYFNGATARVGASSAGTDGATDFTLRANGIDQFRLSTDGDFVPPLANGVTQSVGTATSPLRTVTAYSFQALPVAGRSLGSGRILVSGYTNNVYISASTNVMLVFSNLVSGVPYNVTVSNGANVVITVSNAASLKVANMPAGQFPGFNTNGFTYLTVMLDSVSGATNLVSFNSSENALVTGWKLGMDTNASTQTITLNVTNSQTLIASNQTSVQVDFSAGTPDYYSTDVMRANLSVQPTNLVVGRTATVYLTGDTNANERTVTVITNGIAGGAAIRWFFNTPTNGATSFTVTNTQRAELSLKVLSATEIWAAWSPVR